MKMSPIKQVSVAVLKPNSINKKFFKVENGEYFGKLAADVKKRGIIVPLIAKKDGTLLAGHNRLLVAKTLKLKTVPVQYVQGKLTKKQEEDFIVKDNLLRRHLDWRERMSLYQRMYDNFNDRVLIKNDTSGVGLTAKKVADDLGLSPTTVGYDFGKIRRAETEKRNKESAVSQINIKAIQGYKKAISKMLNIAIMEKGETIEEFKTLTGSALARLDVIGGLSEVKKRKV